MSEEALQIVEKRREVKVKGEKERHNHLNAEFQRIARRDKKAFLSEVFPSIRVFSSELILYIRWPKYWSFSFSISRSNEYSGLISFRVDWLDLLEVQGTLKSLLQHHNSKASILLCSAFFIVQLSHPYVTTRKTIALTR